MQFEMDRRHVVIEHVSPEIDNGRFPIKRVAGEKVVVEADIFAEGHEAISCVLMYRKEGTPEWTEVPMTPLVNDRWQGEFSVEEPGLYFYTFQGWLDHFKFWVSSLHKRVDAAQDVSIELLIGANLVDAAAERAAGDDKENLVKYAAGLRVGGPEAIQEAFSPELSELAYRYAPRGEVTQYHNELKVAVDRERARFSAWYEFFPRSLWTTEGSGYATLKDAVKRLPYIAGMGFDVVYLPPVTPIGNTHRKGKNNDPLALAEDVGSPWAIGAEEGGHKTVDPRLGTLDDLRNLVAATRDYGMEIAVDVAFQVSPDHPYAVEHKDWFKMRPDGTIQYAENPPKKYEDIYPFDFETKDWKALWEELKSIFQFWLEQGVRVFRVDNPHTKPFRMWEWLIGELKRQYPDAIFLAEAFTRPKVMYYLAKSGFTQSYTYFAWRNSKWELTEYLTELTQTEVSEYYRPNFWPNTPDILTEYLQSDGRAAFIARLVLAATLSSNYGIYGPAFELMANRAIAPGKEEYLNSEKYEIKHWDIDRPDSLKDTIASVNRARKDNPALQSNAGLRFHRIDNESLIAYSKSTPEGENVVLAIVNLDFHYKQSGWVELPLDEFGLDEHQPYQVHDLLTDKRYIWSGRWNYVELDPQVMPAHILRVRRRVRSEKDFDYYL